jgi:hypothetical protein
MKNIPNCISGGTVIRDPDGNVFDRGVPESAQIWLLVHKFYIKVAWLAQCSILSVLTI